MNQTGVFLGGAVAGAACMFFLDPVHGGRRRALARDRAIHISNQTSEFGGKVWRDLSNRAQGWRARSSRAGDEDPAAPGTLVARVRAKLGRVVSHPRAVEVLAEGGCVLLRGDVPRTEHRTLISAVQAVRGVRVVVDELHVHVQTADVPSLQGGSPREERGEWRQENWSPAMRLGVGAVGGLLAAYALLRRDPLSAALGLAGAGLLARTTVNAPLSRLATGGVGATAHR